jgi:tetratricopeptide (TPR) repeat protein
MDRLEEEVRGTLELASVIGRTFYYRVLEYLAEAEAELNQHLSALQRVDLIHESARLPELEYMFRHELTRDAAYKSMLRKRRRQFHREVGEALETLFPERLGELAPRLGHHFEVAGDAERAQTYYTQAGEEAARLYANEEANAHFSRALEMAMRRDAPAGQIVHLHTRRGRTMELGGQYDDALAGYDELEKLAHERDSRQMELAALTAKGTIHSTYTDSYDPELGDALSRRALALAQELGDPRAEAKSYWNLMLVRVYNEAEADRGEAIGYGEKSLAVAREHNLREEMAYALHDLTFAYFGVGRFDDAVSARAEALGLWRELGNQAMQADCLAGLAFGSYLKGDLDAALAQAKEALQIGRSIRSAWAQGYSLNQLGPIYLETGEFGEAVEAWLAAVQFAEEAKFIEPQISGNLMLGWMYGYLGDIERGFEFASRSRAAFERMGGSVADSVGPIGVLAVLHAYGGRPEEATRVMSEVLPVLGDPTGLSLISELEPALRMFQAEVALANQDYQQALDVADHVVQIVHRMGLRAFLPDHLHLKARALRGLGQVDEARETLLEARAEAEAMGSRRTLWPVLAELSQLEAESGNIAEAEQLREQAREEALYVADRVGSRELRESFLNTPVVKALFAS